ncbi:phytoene desaturase family protein [Angustibacter luteus]|uniref:Phytoene desaturase family protein n=1 Tax=Angustibacter luteus TaxID=658456 RepID=A0ABW1JBJ8_9ACTN
MARIVVVGAGMGGLAVAARLAAQRHDVTVVERSDTVGGKLGWFTRDGFSFDTGPSLLTLPAVYRDLFLKTGAALDRSVELVEVDPVCHYRFPDGTEVDLPNASRGRVVRALDEALGTGSGAQWAALMDRAGAMWEITRGPFLESPLDGARTLVGLSRRVGDLRTVAPWRTLRGLGRSYLRDPRLVMLLDRYATYTGSDPRRAPAALATVPYLEQTFGAWYVRGGLHQLGEALHQRVVETGAQVLTSSTVTEVLVEGDRVSGVLLAGGRRIEADVVVSDADAAHLYGDLVRSPAADRARTSLAGATPSLSGFVLLLALRGRTPGLAHHTVLFPQDYDDEFDSVFGTGPHSRAPRPAPDPTVYVSAPDDPALRPDDDHESLFVLVNAPRHSVDDAAAGIDWDAPGLASSYADRVLDVMASRGLDVRDRVVWRELRTPADLARATSSVGGSIYGSSSNGVRSAFLRPANRSPVEGLFLVGGSAHPGGGLPLVGLSAAIVAEQIGRA